MWPVSGIKLELSWVTDCEGALMFAASRTVILQGRPSHEEGTNEHTGRLRKALRAKKKWRQCQCDMRGMKHRQESRIFSIFSSKGVNSRLGEMVGGRGVSMDPDTQNPYGWEDVPTEASAAFLLLLFRFLFSFFWVSSQSNFFLIDRALDFATPPDTYPYPLRTPLRGIL
jgi:hypothetical protein